MASGRRLGYEEAWLWIPNTARLDLEIGEDLIKGKGSGLRDSPDIITMTRKLHI